MRRQVLLLRESQLSEIRAHFARAQGKEAAGYLSCGLSSITSDPWDTSDVTKFLARKFSPISVESASDRHVTWKTDSFVHALHSARVNEEAVALVHSHPSGFASFSAQDDQNELDLIKLAQKRNGATSLLVSIVMLPEGALFGRVWRTPTDAGSLDLIVITGRRFTLHFPGRGSGESPEFLNRQAIALGPAFNEDLSRLRIAVVGCGGTGSATASLLARLGAKFLALFDADVVHETNLNRLHFSSKTDAEMQRYKVDVVADGIRAMGLGTQVKAYHQWISSPECRDALRSCDIIFGCTDDNAGRLFLNRFAYFYNVPLIDMGLAIDVDHGEPPRVKAFDGRVTVIQPGATCLLCREIINPIRAREESLRRTNPDEYERQKAEAYVFGEGNPSPAVVPFTTGLAAMAVEELIHRLQGFRGPNGSVEQRLRKFHLITDRRQSYQPSPDCPICSSQNYWGRGDVDPFLDFAA